jgi:phage gp37-like protein
MYVPIITAVELAIVDRLTRGLGKMVTEVKTYGGEFDDDELDTVVRRFPATWVTFGGVKRTDAVSTSRSKWKAEATFVVMVGARSVRNEQTSRHGGPAQSEVGTNLLVSAVRHLLNQQDMGLPIRNLEPGSIRTLFNTSVRGEAMSVYALEFRTAWVEDTLFLGAFPQGAVEGPLGAVFDQYGGQIDPETPDWKATLLSYFLKPGTDRPADAADQIEMPQE